MPLSTELFRFLEVKYYRNKVYSPFTDTYQLLIGIFYVLIALTYALA